MTLEIDKNELKKILATAVHEVAPKIKVDLKNPETVILVEVVKVSSFTLLIILYIQYFKININNYFSLLLVLASLMIFHHFLI